MRISARNHAGLYMFDVYDDEAKKLFSIRSKLNKEYQWNKVAARLKITPEILQEYIQQLANPGETVSFFVSETIENYFTVREATGESKQVESFEAALVFIELPEQPIIQWTNLSGLAAVDADIQYPLSDMQALSLLEKINPVPRYAWRTHGGGLRLIYEPLEHYTAEELAVLSMLSLWQTDKFYRIEIKRDTRHPLLPYKGKLCSSIYRAEQSINSDLFKSLLQELTVDNEIVQEWLEENGFSIGERYNHSRCPLNPSAKGQRKPVTVVDKGIYCHYCGSTGKGFISFASLCGIKTSNYIHLLVKNFAHYEHAKYFLEKEYHGLPSLNTLYKALLKVWHGGEDPRVNIAARMAKDTLLRYHGYWGDANNQMVLKGIEHALSCYPAVLTDNGRLRKDRLIQLVQPNDISQLGYPELNPVFGVSIFGTYNQHTKPTIVVQNSLLRSPLHESIRPVYRPKENRMELEGAWKEIESVCPGVNRELIYLLIAARGCVESGKGLPPMICLTGPTGSSKSASVHLAAGILGDRNTEVVWSNDADKLRRAVIQAKTIGTYCTFNEVIKEGATHLDFLLNLTEESVCHQLYVGPVKLGTLPVIVLTDTHLPTEVFENAQISRRVKHIHLSRQLFWEKPLTESGLNFVDKIRLRFNLACDAILSHVIDTYFTEPLSFQEIASTIGLASHEAEEIQEQTREKLKNFFDLVCSLPEITDETDKRRWRAKGYKIINCDTADVITTLWKELCDNGSQKESRLVREQDWQRILNSNDPVNVSICNHGSKVAIRFFSATNRTIVNEELVSGVQSIS